MHRTNLERRAVINEIVSRPGAGFSPKCPAQMLAPQTLFGRTVDAQIDPSGEKLT